MTDRLGPRGDSAGGARRIAGRGDGALREAYEAWHQDHRTGEGPWYGMVRGALSQRATLTVGARILEIGCGEGTFSRWLASQSAAAVVGADFASTAISRARQGREAPNLTFEVQDVQRLSYRDAEFDLIVSCETLEHVPNPSHGVLELARVLRPGGTLLLTMPNYFSVTGLHRLWRMLSGRGWDEGGQPLVNWTAYPRTRMWLFRAGLEVRATAGHGFYVPVPRHTGPPKDHVPPPWLYPLVKPLALHLLMSAQKPAT